MTLILVDNRLAEYIWWGIPLVLTLIIAVLTWVKTHELDPYKPIESNKKANDDSSRCPTMEMAFYLSRRKNRQL